MCRYCDDPAEWLEITELRIRVHGWTAISVGDTPTDRHTWTYTIGLRENFGHPDLLVLDTEPRAAYRLIDGLATNVVTHGEVGPHFAAAGGLLVPVHPSRFAGGLVAGWEDFFDRDASHDDFVEVVFGPVDDRLS